MTKRRQRYTEKYRQECVAAYRAEQQKNPHVTITACAQQLGVPTSTLNMWIRDGGTPTGRPMTPFDRQAQTGAPLVRVRDTAAQPQPQQQRLTIGDEINKLCVALMQSQIPTVVSSRIGDLVITLERKHS